jgi:serine kinase of HPr protein (carbohydrate metabolism regulator)
VAELSSETLHASTVAIDGRAVVIEGRSGAGKSDLALRLIDRGAALVADDQTVVRRVAGVLVAAAPPTIAGRIEVRGLGIVPLPHVEAEVALVIRLSDTPERLPEPSQRRIAGVAVRELALDPRPASAPIAVELALRHPASAERG